MYLVNVIIWNLIVWPTINITLKYLSDNTNEIYYIYVHAFKYTKSTLLKLIIVYGY